MLGLQTAAGIPAQRAHEQSLGLVVFDVIIALAPAPAVGLAQLGPTVGLVNRAAEPFGIDKSFDHLHRMAIAGLPVIAEPIQRQAQNPGAQIGHAKLRQHKKSAVVSHQAQTAATLFVGPTNPFITMLEVLGWRAENQHRHPLPARIPGQVIKTFAHRTNTTQIVMFIE